MEVSRPGEDTQTAAGPRLGGGEEVERTHSQPEGQVAIVANSLAREGPAVESTRRIAQKRLEFMAERSWGEGGKDARGLPSPFRCWDVE